MRDGFTPNTQYFLLSKSSWTFAGGGGGGQSDWDGHGTATASGGGFVSTSTYYSEALLNRATVSVTVSIGGVEGRTTVPCD